MCLENLKKFIIEKLNELKIENIEVIDVSKKTSLTKYMIICTAIGDRHVDSTAENLRTSLKEKFNIICKRPEGKTTGWILLDLGDIFVNIFTEENRNKYKLEELWTKEIK